MCVRAHILTPLHEDEMLMIQAKAFLSPAPMVVGPRAESRGHDSTLGAVPIRCCSPKQDALSEELPNEGDVS